MLDIPQVTKSIIRKSILALREQLLPELRALYSASITEHLLQLPEYRQADVVLGYMNFGSEYASELWIARVLTDHKRLVLPRINHHTNQLDLYYVEDLKTQLAPGLWGIREPVVERCERLNTLNEVEFALLPGVAFSMNGARLGYGGGYYDKLLARFPHQPALVSGAFSMQVVEDIPQESTDRTVEWLMTEQKIIHCATTD